MEGSLSRIVIAIAVVSFFSFCNTNVDDRQPVSEPPAEKPVLAGPGEVEEEAETIEHSVPEIEQRLIDHGLINIRSLDTSIIVDLKYASSDNFIGVDVYEGLANAYLQPEVAKKLIAAQACLKKEIPDHSLIIFDAARPLSVQQTMWDTLNLPFEEKIKYLSNPQNGSIHNYGAAVDLSIVDENLKELDMGTPYDFFGELAHPSKEQEMLEQGLLSVQQVDNRKLLRKVMKKSGFFTIPTEWWHFNSCTRDRAKEIYSLIE